MKLNFGSKILFAGLICLALFLAAGTLEAQTPNLLYNFGASPDGANPSSLTADSSGNLFVTTFNGGANGFGAVFEFVNSSGSYTEKVLYSFTGINGDGASPSSVIMDSAGNLYGTSSGGANGNGAVFELVNSSGSYTEKVLYSFTGTNGDGAGPFGLIMDSSANLYGTTNAGGASGKGTVFELVNSSGSYTEKVLYGFTGTNGDGANPYAGVIMDSSGNLYGTTRVGGANGNGTVFELVNSSSSYTEKVLHSFTGTNGDGVLPQAGVIVDSYGNLYGTTSGGGANGHGTVFELVNSSGSYNLRVVHNFGGPSEGFPQGNLVIDSSGNLYGTTGALSSSGLPFAGEVFELINQSGNYNEAVLLNAGSTYCGVNIPYAPDALTFASSGNLYGTTLGDIVQNNTGGSVFSLSRVLGPAAPTTTTLASSSNPANAGDPLTFTASVNSSFEVNTGTVTFSSFGTTLATQPIACGAATLSFEDALAAGIGTYTVTAQYNPALPSLAPSSAALSQTVYEAGAVVTNGNNTIAGNETVTGGMNASTFSGNGSGLTNVLAAGLSCTSCIGNPQLAINYAASGSQGGPASNALMLGGLLPGAFQPAGSYATTGANFFTGNQFVSGNLATTGNTQVGAKGTPIVQHLSMTFSPSFGTLTAGCTSNNFSFPGVNDGDTVALGIPNERMTAADVIYTAWVSAANTVTIRACAFTIQPKTLGSGAIRVDVWQH